MSIPTPCIFVADDQRDVVGSLRLLLKGEGYGVETFDNPDALVEALRVRRANVLLMDLNYTRDTTSGEEGLAIVARIRAFDSQTPIVVMTAWGSTEIAVEAMRRGAQDFVEKPWDNDRLLTVLRTQIALSRSKNRARGLEAENRKLTASTGELIAESPAMQPVLETIERIAPTDTNVLITGESGCGKGLIARIFHERSPRADQSLVIVNIGALSETVFESELFGHVKGAFTDARTDRVGRFELANGGTLFLDEIANIPIVQQSRLLRVLEGGEYERLGSSRTRQTDVRILSATNADIQAEIGAGNFRTDLLYRLNTIHIHLPPLRERGDDIARLARQFLGRHAAHYRRTVEGFTDASISAMRRYPWPGNVRELSHVIERAVLMTSDEMVGPADLRLDTAEVWTAHRPRTLEAIEQEAIRAALARNDGNVIAAADELGMSRSALYRRMDKLALRTVSGPAARSTSSS